MKKQNYTYKDYDKALARQKERYKKRVASMMQEDLRRCYFLTITFSNKTLKETSEKTRLRYIKAFLNKQAKEYLLNIDYGEETNREHYHAVILSHYKIIVFEDFKNGFIKAENLQSGYYRFRTTEETLKRLINHAFKKTNLKAKIIYSRINETINKSFDAKAKSKLYLYEKGELKRAKESEKAIQSEEDLIKEIDKQFQELEDYIESRYINID